MTLTFINRLKICIEVLTARSGHKCKAQEKQLPTFKRGYAAGYADRAREEPPGNRHELRGTMMHSEHKDTEPTPDAGDCMERIIMREYSQGIAYDGAAILCDGRPMTIEQILARLRTLEDVRGIIYDSPELNPSNYDHKQACQLNTAMCEAWSIIEADA